MTLPLPLDPARLRSAKTSYTTRHVDLSAAVALDRHATPRAGDLVLATVTAVGQHPKIEKPDGRRAQLFPGDEVVVAYGNRYAPDQFEAEVPGDLGPCDLVAAGGIAGRVLASHGKMRVATSLAPAGLLVDADGRPLTVGGARLEPAPACPAADRPVTVLVAGAAMNAGKTTTAAHLARGLRLAGRRVGAAKVTGTGAGGDVWLLTDAGAFPVYDFTHAGLPSTYLVEPERVFETFVELQDRLAADGCEVIVVEVADGVLQRETSALLADPRLAERVDAVLFAAYDALGACTGQDWLVAHGLAPLALSGVLSTSPLASREAEAATGLDVWGLSVLEDPERAEQLMVQLLDNRGAAQSEVVVPYPEQEAVLTARSS